MTVADTARKGILFLAGIVGVCGGGAAIIDGGVRSWPRYWEHKTAIFHPGQILHNSWEGAVKSAPGSLEGLAGMVVTAAGVAAIQAARRPKKSYEF